MISIEDALLNSLGQEGIRHLSKSIVVIAFVERTESFSHSNHHIPLTIWGRSFQTQLIETRTRIQNRVQTTNGQLRNHLTIHGHWNGFISLNSSKKTHVASGGFDRGRKHRVDRIGYLNESGRNRISHSLNSLDQLKGPRAEMMFETYRHLTRMGRLRRRQLRNRVNHLQIPTINWTSFATPQEDTKPPGLDLRTHTLCFHWFKTNLLGPSLLPNERWSVGREHDAKEVFECSISRKRKLSSLIFILWFRLSYLSSI